MSDSELPGFISRSVLRGRYLFLDHPRERDKGGHTHIICAGWEECSRDYEIRRTGFNYHAVEYISGGRWELSSQGKKWIIGPGSFFTYGPNLPYALRPITQTRLTKYFIDFRTGDAWRTLRRAGIQPGVPVQLNQGRWVQDLLEQIIDLQRLRPAVRTPIANALTDALLRRLPEDLLPTAPDTAAMQTFERCRDAFAANYLQLGRLSDAARLCGVSQVHLCRLFQRFSTETPRAHLIRLKMNHAAERISRGRLPVKEAAFEVGFDDPFHFSRVFKSVHGVAPSKFGNARPG